MLLRHVLVNLFVLAVCFLVSASALETDSYSPSSDVKQGHSLPHYTPASTDNREADYLLSTIVPAAGKKGVKPCIST